MSFIGKKQFCVNCFFAAALPWMSGAATGGRAPGESDSAFQGHVNVILRFKPAAASAGMIGSGDVEEQ
jgi:hypothetical protein